MDKDGISVIQTSFNQNGEINKKGNKWLKKLKKKEKSTQRKINNYILGETLGMGGYSKVKLGFSEKTHETVALKIMFAESDTGKMSASKKKQLKRELEVMEKVKHKNVIQLIEYDEDAEYPAADDKTLPCILVVLEFAPGGELFDYLMFTGKFDEKATRTYFHQFLDGLEAIHKSGICHRDLKPENLLLDSQCNLKIADFGFATQFRSDDGYITKMKTACGTKGYLSPELLKGKKYTHKCDIFAMGIIMFTTYAGFPPFQNAVESDWWWDKLNKGWKYLEQSKRLNDVMEIEKHLKASKIKKELFWKAHERSCKFDDDFKFLIEYTLHPMASCRYDIKHIRKNKWFIGDGNGLYNAQELKKFLNERVNKVKKERVDKIKKQLNDNPKQLVSGQDFFAARPIFNTSKGKDIYSNVIKEDNIIKQFDNHVKNFNDCFAESKMNQFESNFNSTYKFETHLKPSDIAARVNYIGNSIHALVHNDVKQSLILLTVNIKFGDSNDEKQDFYNEKVKFSVKQYKMDTKESEKDKYLVTFSRLIGAHQAYKQAVETFFYHYDMVSAMI